jgi:predicted metal-dependent HD superfamily phosphohydrolase
MLTTMLSQTHRHYHDITHVNDCLVEFYDYLDNGYNEQDYATLVDAQIKVAITSAIWYHDIVYNTYAPAGSNEALSAELFREEQSGRYGGECIDWTKYAIRCTATHLDTQTFDDAPSKYAVTVAKIMLDIDLAGFGQPYSTYVRNSINIEKEYYRTLPMDFLQGRQKFLTKLSERHCLYYTKFFGEKYSHRAWKNIECDLGWLADAIDADSYEVYAQHQAVALTGEFD